MPRYAAFLRAVNLGSTNKASKEQLREAFEGAGLEDVSTFRTSGNVVFDGGREAAAKLTTRVEKALKDALGFEVPVYLRTEKELRAIAAAEPFDASVVEQSTGKLQVGLLQKRASTATQKKILELATADDLLAIEGRELYWLPAAGVGRSELNHKAVGKLTGPQTVRTMGTMQTIVAKFFHD